MMNDRIKEIADEADAVVITMMTGNKQYTFLESDLEKFASLIIKECATVLVQHGSFSSNSEPYNYGASLIEEHFGVKE